MGWSATAAACEVMDALYDYCRDTEGSSNSWNCEGRKYFAERGKEHQDGHISMTIYKMVGEKLCKRSGSIYIEPDGKIRRMPGYLQKAIEPYMPKTRAHLWMMACEFDKIPTDSMFVCFSEDNPYVEQYNAAVKAGR